MPLWRYMDLPKLVSLLTSKSLWLTNAEVLAIDDPHEGTLSTPHFAYRQWANLEEVPEFIRAQIVELNREGTDGTPQAIFRRFVKEQEEIGHFTKALRRSYSVSCWHASKQESVAMWKIYAAPGPGIAVISNGARIEKALAGNDHELYFGHVKYFDEKTYQIDWTNTMNAIMAKRLSFLYEQEVRLVHLDEANLYNPLSPAKWNEETLRYENLVSDPRPLSPGLALNCDIDTLIERVMVSPFSPPWYAPMLEQLRDQLGFKFQVCTSDLLSDPIPD